MTDKTPTIVHAIDTTGPGGAETVFLDIAQQLHLANYDNLAIIKGSGWVEVVSKYFYQYANFI